MWEVQAMPLIGVFPHGDRNVVVIADTMSCVSDAAVTHFPFNLQEETF